MKINIIFASETGTTKYVAELLKKRFVDQQHTVDLYQVGVDGFEPKTEGYDLILFGSPTYFSGQLPPDMATYTLRFTTDLSHYKVAVFSLGDSGYPHFCASAEILEQWVQKHGGNMWVPTIKIDGYPQNFTELTEWVASIIKKS